MVTVGLLASLEAKPGKEQEVQQLLEGALSLAQQEPDTVSYTHLTLPTICSV